MKGLWGNSGDIEAMFWWAWVAMLLLLLFARPAKAQLPPGAIAVTSCLGGRTQTSIDVDVIGTDSLQEILVHEAKHREQALRVLPNCPVYDNVFHLLTDEVEAYCASRPVRMVRGYTEREVDMNYIARLIVQFNGAMSRRTIIDSYHYGCPSTRGNVTQSAAEPSRISQWLQ